MPVDGRLIAEIVAKSQRDLTGTADVNMDGEDEMSFISDAYLRLRSST